MSESKQTNSMFEKMTEACGNSIPCGDVESMSKMMNKFFKSDKDTFDCQKMMQTMCSSMFEKSKE